MIFENLLTLIENGILTITINRPDKLNALNKKTVEEIGLAIRNAENNRDIKGIIITGAGEKAFVAGADISELFGLSIEEGKNYAKAGQLVFESIERSSKPVIAAINGFALGAGCELAMACHLRIAGENAKFGQPEVSLGLISAYGGTQRLIQYIGKTKATELHLTGDLISAEEALKLGLVNYVVPKDKIISKCVELLEKIKSKSPTAISSVINSLNSHFEKDVDGFNTEIEEFGRCLGTEDFKEGTSAFIEKRKAVFVGK